MTVEATHRLAALRDMARAMLDDRSEAALRRQAHPELSPLLWHVGHVFFVENYWLAERVFGDTSVTDRWRALYFPSLCAKPERSARLPGPAAMREWTHDMAHINAGHWRRAESHAHPLLDGGYLESFVRQHYAQHLETMRMVAAQLDLADRPTPSISLGAAPVARHSTAIAGGRIRLGTDGIEAYDNEQPPTEYEIAPFRVAERPVSNAEWRAFMADGGYEQPELWDETGWAWRIVADVRWPQHWQPADDTRSRWIVPALGHNRPAADEAPVHGISWYEARAFARWADARLPTEAEWETAARQGRLGDVGTVWEWCDDAFAPYPGFRPFPYDEYSLPWFDGGHFVARGGSVHTEAEIRRPGFRNFYEPTHRHVFAGLRLAG